MRPGQPRFTWRDVFCAQARNASSSGSGVKIPLDHRPSRNRIRVSHSSFYLSINYIKLIFSIANARDYRVLDLVLDNMVCLSDRVDTYFRADPVIY